MNVIGIVSSPLVSLIIKGFHKKISYMKYCFSMVNFISPSEQDSFPHDSLSPLFI